ncbi:hypothetical protein BBJ28_00013141 [Nothophytophthora sp. Chile5]|nr:hypothetical protein BBJ28_00013141 [Nothophytophthora sp. Chile5]
MAPAKALMALINQAPAYIIDRQRVDVYFVSTKKDWLYCEGRLRKAQLMGFDTETRPVWIKNRKRNPCALLQIAVRDTGKKEEVFVLDLLHLPAKVYNTTLSSIFLSKKVIKLGQSFYNDLQELAESYPTASCFRVCKGVVEVNDLSVSLAGGHNPLSLQKLVFFYLHCKLTKTQQTSNWERRPLAASQLHYAAADALVLLHLYDEIMLRIQKEGAAAATTFRLSDVTNVLDVNLSPAPKCSLCFETFEKAPELKKHRKICVIEVRKLDICSVCEGKKLVTAKVMDHHVQHCGVQEETAEPVVQVKRKRSLSVDKAGSEAKSRQEAAVPASGRNKCRKMTAQPKADQPTDGEEILPESPAKDQESKKKRRKAAKKAKQAARKSQSHDAQPAASVPAQSAATSTRNDLARKRKQRKMSMESSLLASDAVWSQISNDHSSSSK